MSRWDNARVTPRGLYLFWDAKNKFWYASFLIRNVTNTDWHSTATALAVERRIRVSEAALRSSVPVSATSPRRPPTRKPWHPLGPLLHPHSRFDWPHGKKTRFRMYDISEVCNVVA
jgi:hypothetical protein